MAFLEQILDLPHVVYWLPIGVFVAIAGGAYWLMRPTPQLVNADVQDAKIESAVVVKPNQRGAHRRQGNPVEVYIAPLEDKEDKRHGSVLDRSLGGIRLALYEEVAIGTVVAIRPVNADQLVPWVEVEIRSCRPSEEMPGRFEVGCAYVKAPPYSIQLLFG